MRRFRNAGRGWFGDDHEITRDEQERWWATHTRSEGFACVLAGEPPVGYGMLQRRADGRRWVALAVAPARRGQGVGTEIYRVLLRMASSGESIYAGIRRDNAPSITAALKAGYRPDDVVKAPVADPDRWLVLRGDGWVVIPREDDYPAEVLRRAQIMDVHPARLLPHEGPEACPLCGCDPGEEHHLATHDAADDLLIG